MNSDEGQALRVLRRNLRGKGEGHYHAKKFGNDLLEKLNEILYDDEISQSEAIYIRQKFRELQVEGWKDLEGILEAYGQPDVKTADVVTRREMNPIRKRKLVFLSIVGPAAIASLIKIII